MVEIKPYKFVKWEAGNKITIADGKTFLCDLYSGSRFAFGLVGVIDTGIYNQHGWAYDLRPYLKRFWFSQYGMLYSAYAPSKSMLRHVIHGRILKIVEVV